MSNAQKPSVGRIVHYYPSGGGPPRAAIVSWVMPDTINGNVVGLHVFIPGENGADWRPIVAYSEAPAEGCWSWPPRV